MQNLKSIFEPSIEHFDNCIGLNNEWLIIAASGMIALYFVILLILKYPLLKQWILYKKGMLYPFLAFWLGISYLFYLGINCINYNIDDLYTRQHGKEYRAEVQYEYTDSKVYDIDNIRTQKVRNYSFIFIPENQTITQLNLGLSYFANNKNVEKGDSIRIRYIAELHKLSIASEENSQDNIQNIIICSILLSLLVLLLKGKLAFIYKWIKWDHRKIKEET